MKNWFLKREFNGLHMISCGVFVSALNEGAFVAGFIFVTIMAAITTWLER